jgi:NTE family protein
MFDFMRRNKKKVTLVLGGGSARGIAHVGVLRVLEREGITIDRIVGTSMGALIGAAYATGTPLKEMEEKAYGFSVNKLLDPTIGAMGLLAGNRLEAIVRTLLDSKTFADCKIPMAVVTTDIESGDQIIHQSGDLIKVIRATCSWPGIFAPVNINGRLLCDGGIKNSVPAKIARDLASENYIIAVDVGFCVKRGKMENIFQIILQSLQIIGEELNQYQSTAADAVIKVDLPGMDQIAFNRSREIVVRGAEAAEAKMNDIKKDLHIR